MNIVESISDPAWRAALRSFRAWLKLERQLSDNSVEAYLRDVSHLAQFAIERGKTPAGVTLDDLRGLVEQLNDMGVALATQCRIVSGLRTFYHMLVHEDTVADNPATLLEMPRREGVALQSVGSVIPAPLKDKHVREFTAIAE